MAAPRRIPLVWKLLAINGAVISLVLVVMYLSVQYLAADYFAVLMERYHISPVEVHAMFLDAVYHALGWAALAGLVTAALLGYLLTHHVLRPLTQMIRSSSRIAEGDFAARIGGLTTDEIGTLGESFNRMAERLEGIQSLRRQMVIDVAHELRTPLTNLVGYLEALRDGLVEPSDDTLQSLQEETARLVSLVEDVLALARADSAATHLARNRVDLRALVEEVLHAFEPGFAEKRITLEPPDWQWEGLVVADRAKLDQVMRNLVDNALNYTPEGGCVRLFARPGTRGPVVGLENTGEGIARNDLPHVFERFYRPERSRSRESGGAGIGLAIVKELVAAHGGEVGAESEAGRTRVWFSLPA